MKQINVYSTALYRRPATNWMLLGEFVTTSDIRLLESIGYELIIVE